MKKLVLVWSCFLFSGIYNAYSQQQAVSDDDKHYSLNIPAGWVHASSKNAIITVFMCSDTIHPEDRLSIMMTKSIYNLAKTYKTNKDAYKDVKNYKFIQEGDASIGGQPSKWFLCTFSREDGVNMKGIQNTVLTSGKSYIIQYFIPEERYDAEKDVFEKIVSSMTFNKK
jgi:hypothetical protein